VELAGLEVLLAQSDVASLHCPLKLFLNGFLFPSGPLRLLVEQFLKGFFSVPKALSDPPGDTRRFAPPASPDFADTLSTAQPAMAETAGWKRVVLLLPI
jgi:hypothetical protein